MNNSREFLEGIFYPKNFDQAEVKTDADYFKGPGVSRSDLKNSGKSLANLVYERAQPEKEQSSAMLKGSLVHTLVLEPETFGNSYVFEPEVNKRTNAGKEELKAFYEKIDRLVPRPKIISKDLAEEAKAIADKVLSHPIVRGIVKDAEAEKLFYAKDPATGILCKAKADLVTGDCLIDLKTTKDASPTGFSKAVVNFNYDLQAAHYLETANDYLEESFTVADKFKNFLFICVETSEPYRVAVYNLNDASLEVGSEMRRKLLEGVANYKNDKTLESGAFGYPVEIKDLGLPAFGFDTVSRLGGL